MSHSVYCSRCSRKFDRGVTSVYRFVVFHFCAQCWRFRQSCNDIMRVVCGEAPEKARAAVV